MRDLQRRLVSLGLTPGLDGTFCEHTVTAVAAFQASRGLLDSGICDQATWNAVIEAGHKRARPIVMTSIAMSAGMLPSALGVGEGGSFRAPMATAVIGGIIVSTVLSLVIVPSFFLIMDDLSSLLARIFGRFIGRKEDEPVEPAAHELAAQIETRAIEIALLNARVGSLEEVAANRRGPKALHVAE